nr:ABC-three component system protein [Fibrobacter sp. UWH5]
MSEAKQLDFDEVATAVRAAYKKIANLNQKKSEVLSELKKWILSKTGSDDEVACEIFISYFVQNCEVFDEITE